MCLTGEEVPPVVTVSPNRIGIAVGADVTFNCRPEGRGPFTINWIRADGLPLPARGVIRPDNSLFIPNIQSVDSGRYICVVVNPWGRNQQEVDLTVIGQLWVDLMFLSV